MPNTFVMTQAHMHAFSRQQRQRFEDEMLVYLQGEYPAERAKMGDAWMRDLIRRGIDKAKGYEITLEVHVAAYIELMMTLSPDFDASDRTPWAAGILSQRVSGAAKLEQLYEHLMFQPQPEGQ